MNDDTPESKAEMREQERHYLQKLAIPAGKAPDSRGSRLLKKSGVQEWAERRDVRETIATAKKYRL